MSNTEPVVGAEGTPAVRSQILKMIQDHVSLANRLLDGDVDVYSKGNSPGPVDQYTSGSGRNFMEEVSNPGLNIAQAGEAAAVEAAGQG